MENETAYTRSNIVLRIVLILISAILIGIVLFSCTILIYEGNYQNRVYKGVSVGNVVVGGLNKDEAAAKLAAEIRYPFENPFTFRYDDRVWTALPQDLGFSLQTDVMAENALRVGRSASWYENIREQLACLLFGKNLDAVFLFDERVAFNFITKIAEEIDTPMDQPSITLQGAEVVITPGKSGRMVNRAMAMSLLQIYARNLQAANIDLPVTVLEPTAANLETQTQTLQSLLSKDFVLYTNDERGALSAGTIPADILAGLIDFTPIVHENQVTIEMTPRAEPFQTRLIAIGNDVYREARNARFTFNEKKKALDLLSEAVTGKEIDVEQSLANITESIRSGQNQAEIALKVTPPSVAGTETAEQLGIRELVHTENTYFFYSDDARIQNIQIGSATLNGQLIAPGQTYSMADGVGEVSTETGYAESSVIFGDETVQDVGGGLCQVSTTLFRAAFHYGLPINERHAHGYRVYYYERLKDRTLDPGLAGLDAAVYLPTLDLKFTNDTPYWILMEVEPNPEIAQLQWRFYSTDVKRYVEWESTGLTDVEPEGEAVYRENPELPSGTVKQVDWGIDGGKVTITRTVYQDGLVHINDKFDTHYEAWSDIWEYGPGTPDMPPKGAEGAEETPATGD